VEPLPGLTGLVLAGGASSRMGVDKAALIVDGEPLARRATRVLGSVCGLVLVASGDGHRLAWLGLPEVADVHPGAGPLAGLIAGLEAIATPLVAVVAVDMPDASGAVLRLLAERAPGHDAAVPRTERGLEPLHAVYARAAAPALRAAFEDGERSVTSALERIDVVVVGPGDWASADPSGRFARNLNRPEDLDQSSA
jgi:molybdopterin-guanine dinucleotide biosynthesis protein A